MAIVTTYVCDVSGVQGTKEDFVKVVITPSKVDYYSKFLTRPAIERVVHKDVAKKLNMLMTEKGEDAVPEPTLESKLMVLLKDYIYEIAYDACSDAVSDAAHG